MKFLAKGSNKDIYEIAGDPDHLLFKMSSRISVFDVGALDEDIPHRAQSLERFATTIAHFLKSKNIPQAWDETLSQKHSAYVQKKVNHAKLPSTLGEDMSACGYSMSAMPLMGAISVLLSPNNENGRPDFVPLEVIVRWGVPVGSSLVNKDPERFKVGTRFPKPTVDYTTKLEAQDRVLDNSEAQSLCPEGLSLNRVETFVLDIAQHLHSFFNDKGLELWDAKFELAWDSQAKSLLLVDAITPDEVRLTFKGLDKIPLSKELLRFWLRQTLWYEKVLVAKAKGGNNWREALPAAPQLGHWRKEYLSRVYSYLADHIENTSKSSLLDLLRGQDATLPKPKVCVLGTGGRENALRWRLEIEACSIVHDSSEADATFVSMDSDLADGFVDKLCAQRVWTFGPSQSAAKLEWSKSFGRQIASEAGVPIPFYTRNLEDFASVKTKSGKLPVVKLDGLAAGKGVYLPETQESLDELLFELKKSHSDYIFEERCSGEEASAFFLIERDAWGRERARFMGSAKDFKRRYLGDEGPNTGGMGALAPHPSLKNDDVEIFRKWALATSQKMTERGEPFRGILYLGFMRDPQNGWVLIEYNARMGDPETQALVALWPQEQPILRSFLQLTPITDLAETPESEFKTLCLSLVHPEYPKACTPLDLEEWNFKSNSEVQLFKTSSRTGRLAYLVGTASSYLDAGDKIFDALLESPWKNQIEWRSDILR